LPAAPNSVFRHHRRHGGLGLITIGSDHNTFACG
jgi:hypothetical protein